MIELTDPAKEQIDGYFQGKEPTPVRIFLNSGGWGGPSLAMALDEPKDTDDTFDIKGLTFVVDKTFMENAKTIKIDFSGMGFQLDSNIDLGESGCSGCGSGTCW